MLKIQKTLRVAPCENPREELYSLIKKLQISTCGEGDQIVKEIPVDDFKNFEIGISQMIEKGSYDSFDHFITKSYEKVAICMIVSTIVALLKSEEWAPNTGFLIPTVFQNAPILVHFFVDELGNKHLFKTRADDSRSGISPIQGYTYVLLN